MTHLRQHIEELDVDRWAPITKRAATAAVDAAQRHGKASPAEVAAAAAMSESELIEHRNREGPAPQHLSPVMRLVEADHRRAVAEHQTRQAQQLQRDAEAAAQIARSEAAESARAAAEAREQARRADTAAASKATQHAAELRSAQQTLDELRAELEQVRADAATEQTTAAEQLRAANERAEERAAERREERAAAQQALEEVRAELERVRADAGAEVAAAQEQARAAQERAEQRSAERAAERGAAHQALEELRGELEEVRARSAAEVAAVQGRADGEVATVRAALARARAEADDAVTALHAAQAEAAQARAEAEQARLAGAGAPDLLSVPIPAPEVRAHTGPIEDALSAVAALDQVLEAGMISDGQPVDGEAVRALVATVQRQAADLSEQLHALSARYSDGWQAHAAHTYVGAATQAYGGMLARIASATQRLGQQDPTGDAVAEVVTAMLDAHPWRR